SRNFQFTRCCARPATTPREDFSHAGSKLGGSPAAILTDPGTAGKPFGPEDAAAVKPDGLLVARPVHISYANPTGHEAIVGMCRQAVPFIFGDHQVQRSFDCFCLRAGS